MSTTFGILVLMLHIVTTLCVGVYLNHRAKKEVEIAAKKVGDAMMPYLAGFLQSVSTPAQNGDKARDHVERH